MNIRSNKSVAYPELVRRLKNVDRLDIYIEGTVLHSIRLSPIGEAQEVLQDAGCILVDWDMIEGDFYQLRYMPGPTCAKIHEWPEQIKLRFISIAALVNPHLVLSYQEDGVRKFFGSSGNGVLSSASVEARAQVAQFTRNYPDVSYRWYPIFSEHILAP